jgi:predicted transposase YdaD
VADPATALPGVVERMLDRLNREAGRPLAIKLVTAAYVLAGLRLSKERSRDVFGRVKAMRESTTYMAILEEGGIGELHNVLLVQGRQKFGLPNQSIEAGIRAIQNLKRLRRMCARIMRVNSWEELLATR